MQHKPLTNLQPITLVITALAMMMEIINTTRARLGAGAVHMLELPQPSARGAVGCGRRL
jgi:hypothetical protein